MKRGAVFILLLILSACRHQLPQATNYTDGYKRENTIVELLRAGTKRLRSASSADLSQARAQFELARELAPEDPRVWDALGCVEIRRGGSKLAEFYFREALKRNQNYDRAYMHLASIAESRGDLPAAEELLRTSVAMNPLNLRSRNNLAAFLINHKQASPKSQGEAYGELLKVKSRDEDQVVRHNLAIVEEQANF